MKCSQYCATWGNRAAGLGAGTADPIGWRIAAYAVDLECNKFAVAVVGPCAGPLSRSMGKPNCQELRNECDLEFNLTKQLMDVSGI